MAESASHLERCDLLIEGGSVVTVDPGRRVIEHGSVAVHGSRIVGVGPRDELKARFAPVRTIDARRSAVLPGLIDAHAHAGTTLLRGLGGSLPHARWQNVVEFVGSRASTEWWELDVTLSDIERLKAGTTTKLLMLEARNRGSDTAM